MNTVQLNDDSLVDFIEKHCARYRKLTAFENFGEKLSFADLNTQSLQFAGYLQQELQLEKGDRFAIMLPNILQFPIALCGALRAGLVIVNINPLYTARELTHQLNNAGVKAMIVMENFVTAVAEAMPLTGLQHVIITKIGDCLPWGKRQLVNGYLKYIKRQIPDYYIENAVFYRDIAQQAHRNILSPVECQLSDVAFLQYTGGTTGVPKGATLTHQNILSNISQCLTWLRPKLSTAKDTVIMPLPLYHIFSLISSLFCMEVGARAVLITNPRDIKSVIKVLQRTRFTIFIGLNTLFSALMNHHSFKKINFSALNLVISGGMALQKKVAERWQALTHSVIIEGYGLTEASPVVAINPLSLTHFSGSAGMPISNTEVSVRDNHGIELPTTEIGEFWIRGPQIMRGYWNDPVETDKVITEDGWLTTGDIGYIDSRGMLHIIDRKKDIIIVSGFNVYPSEIERVLMSHPRVKEAAVVGIPSEKTGEAVKAFVVMANNHVSINEVIAFCEQRLTKYKMPKEIECCNSLPKSAVGKVLRKDLRQV